MNRMKLIKVLYFDGSADAAVVNSVIRSAFPALKNQDWKVLSPRDRKKDLDDSKLPVGKTAWDTQSLLW